MTTAPATTAPATTEVLILKGTIVSRVDTLGPRADRAGREILGESLVTLAGDVYVQATRVTSGEWLGAWTYEVDGSVYYCPGGLAAPLPASGAIALRIRDTDLGFLMGSAPVLKNSTTGWDPAANRLYRLVGDSGIIHSVRPL